MSIQWFPGHMSKARNEIQEKLRIIDIVFVLLDARIPYSSQNPMLAEIFGNKPKLYLLTKCDMADGNTTAKWQEKLLKDGFESLPIDSISGYNMKKIESLTKSVLKEKIERDLQKGMKMRAIRAMIVGIPNVGKSTLINKLVNKKVTTVGNMPGVTKAQQWIRLNKNLELLDTPGVLWPKFDDEKIGIHLALTGAIKSELLKKEQLAFYLLDFLRDFYPESLERRYSINISDENIEIIENILRNHGNNMNDYERGYQIVLNDFRNGRIGRITLDRIEYNG